MSNALVATQFPVPSPLGSLDAYVSAVHRIPMLTQEEEHDLARRFIDHDDLDAARQMVLSHLRFVVHVARGYSGYGLQVGDLIQEGNIGLMKAVKRFDPDHGVRLVSFAVHWIRAEMHEFILRNWRIVKVATTKAQRKLFFNLRRMRPDGRSLGPDQVADIARELDVRPEDVTEMEVRLSGNDCALDAPSDDEERYAPSDWLADEAQEPVQVLARRGMDALQGEGLEHALSSLDARSQHIVRARWLADDGGATLHELADEYGISAERVRQIESAALKKLRVALSDRQADFEAA